MKVMVLALLVCLSSVLSAQIEHNFEMGPSNTTCDSLILKRTDEITLIQQIRNTSFRYQEDLKISRYYVPKHVWFYSCDGATGYLIAKESEAVEKVYQEVSQKIWQQFVDTDDPISFYAKLKKEGLLKEVVE